MRLAVAGGGYVGLSTATGFARLDHQVDVIEIDPERVRQLREGFLPFQEPSLADAFREEIRRESIRVHHGYADCNGQVDFAFICTSTPLTQLGTLDTTQVFQAAGMLAACFPAPLRLVVRSTVNPGTVARLQQTFSDRGSDMQFLMNPEFLREGSSLQDFERPSRVVVGGDNEDAVAALASMYNFSDAPLIRTDSRTAELIKLASNAALAVRVSMANEIAQVAEWADADVDQLLDAVGLDPRIGRQYLKPGLGFGGSCLPKDLSAFRSAAMQTGLSTPVFDGASLTNDKAIGQVAARIIEVTRDMSRPKVAILGIGFKPGSDSLRNSQSVRLIRTLLARGYDLTVFDPIAEQNARREFRDDVTYAPSLDEALETSSVVVVLDDSLFASAAVEMHEQVIIDAMGRRMPAPNLTRERVYGDR
jgi:UDPglucose 6-dehydrogenase